jgi:hypothetical protein
MAGVLKMKLRHIVTATAIGLLVMAHSPDARADIVTETYSGYVTSGDFSGDAYTATFTGNTAFGSKFTDVIPYPANAGFNPLPKGTGIVGGSFLQTVSPISAVFTITGGNSYAISGNHASAGYSSLTNNPDVIGAFSDQSSGKNGTFLSLADFAYFPLAAANFQNALQNGTFTESNNGILGTGMFYAGTINVDGVPTAKTTSSLDVTSITVTVVPLPATLPLLTTAFLGLGVLARKKRKALVTD